MEMVGALAGQSSLGILFLIVIIVTLIVVFGLLIPRLSQLDFSLQPESANNANLAAAAVAEAGATQTILVNLSELDVRQRLDDHAFERHGMNALAALVAIKVCPALEIWWCPASEVHPESFAIMCQSEDGQVAIGFVSATPRETGEHVLLTHFFAGSYADFRSKLQLRGCTPAPNIRISFIN